MNREYTLNQYFEIFQTDKNKIDGIFATALQKGGDYCDIFFEKNSYKYIGLDDHKVNKASLSLNIGAGIRVIKGNRTGYSFSEDLSLKSLENAAKIAAQIADAKTNYKYKSFSTITPLSLYNELNTNNTLSTDDKVKIALNINNLIFKEDKRIIKGTVSIHEEESFILIASSNGKISYDYRPMTQISVSCTAEQDGKRENNGHSLSARRCLNYYTEDKIKYLVGEAVSRTVKLFDAKSPEGGEMELILSAGSSGILLHEAIGHGMEADFIRKGVSIFADKLGKKVAKDFITIVDDGTIPYSRGSINIDDENSESQNTVLIENGILTGFMHDRISAKHFGVKPTGNGRRESFKYPPLPRMRNTYMLPGPHKKEEIIKTVKKGIIAENFTNGQVLIGAGDFTFYVKYGYLIENGKITSPIKDINIIGNGPDILSKIEMVGDDLKMAEGGWTCGKDGQSVPVSMGLPTVKVSSITVGGK